MILNEFGQIVGDLVNTVVEGSLSLVIGLVAIVLIVLFIAGLCLAIYGVVKLIRRVFLAITNRYGNGNETETK